MIVSAIYAQLVTIRDSLGTAILIVEQNARLALNIADSAYVLEGGEIVLYGTAQEVSANPKVRDIYLGVKDANDITAGAAR